MYTESVLLVSPKKMGELNLALWGFILLLVSVGKYWGNRFINEQLGGEKWIP